MTTSTRKGGPHGVGGASLLFGLRYLALARPGKRLLLESLQGPLSSRTRSRMVSIFLRCRVFGTFLNRPWPSAYQYSPFFRSPHPPAPLLLLFSAFPHPPLPFALRRNGPSKFGTDFAAPLGGSTMLSLTPSSRRPPYESKVYRASVWVIDLSLSEQRITQL